MSDIKISALPVGVATSSTPFPAVVGGVTDQVTLAPIYTSLDGKATTSHTHAESDVTGLTTDLSNLQSDVAELQVQFPIVLTPLNQSAWSWLNQGSAVVNQASNLVRLTAPTDAGENIRSRIVIAPSAPYTVTALVYPGPLRTGATTQIGLCFYESSSGKIVAFGVDSNVASATNTVNVRKNTSTTVNSANTNLGALSSISAYWLRITDNGTNLIYLVSFDGGINYETVLSETRGTFFTVAPDNYGISVQNFGGVISCGGSFASLAVT